jgi:hypothetical protein
MADALRKYHAVVDRGERNVVHIPYYISDAADAVKLYDAAYNDDAPHRAVTLVEWQPWMEVSLVVRKAVENDSLRIRLGGPSDEPNKLRAWLASLPPLPESPHAG